MICPSYTEPLFLFYVPSLSVLIYYSYVPAIITALLIGGAVMWSDHKSLLNRLLFAICVSFVLWTFGTLVDWTNIHSDVLLFAWSFLGPAAAFLSIFSIYFTYVFTSGKDVSVWLKSVFAALLAPIIILAPSAYTLGGFNLASCDAFEFEGFMNTFYFPALGALALVWILILLVRKYRSATKELRKEILLMGIGIEFFLFSFFTTEFLGQYLTKIGILPDSQLETYGYFGMIVFVVYLGILIVRFKAFHVHLIASQALVISLLILLAAQFAFIRTLTNIVLNGIAFVVTVVIGALLIRSVRREIQQREEIEQLATTLEQANERQENLIHFVSHEVKGFLTKDMGAFASLSEGDFGALPESAKPFVEGALAQSRDGARSVMEILTASNMKKGTVEYVMQSFDLKELAEEWVGKLQAVAAAKGLTLTLSADAASGPYTVSGDRNQLGDHVLRNLIENAINYTPKGSVNVSLTKRDAKVVLVVSDTGVGITPEDQKRLFTEGGHGKESIKINVHSTGYGLFIAKSIVNAHGGTISAASDGAGKGSRFTVELPV